MSEAEHSAVRLGEVKRVAEFVNRKMTHAAFATMRAVGASPRRVETAQLVLRRGRRAQPYPSVLQRASPPNPLTDLIARIWSRVHRRRRATPSVATCVNSDRSRTRPRRVTPDRLVRLPSRCVTRDRARHIHSSAHSHPPTRPAANVPSLMLEQVAGHVHWGWLCKQCAPLFTSFGATCSNPLLTSRPICATWQVPRLCQIARVGRSGRHTERRLVSSCTPRCWGGTRAIRRVRLLLSERCVVRPRAAQMRREDRRRRRRRSSRRRRGCSGGRGGGGGGASGSGGVLHHPTRHLHRRRRLRC